jgi:hypothetical protein
VVWRARSEQRLALIEGSGGRVLEQGSDSQCCRRTRREGNLAAAGGKRENARSQGARWNCRLVCLMVLPREGVLQDRAVLRVAARCVRRPGSIQQEQNGDRAECADAGVSCSERPRHFDIARLDHFRHSWRGIPSIVFAVNRCCQWTSKQPQAPLTARSRGSSEDGRTSK